MTQLPERLRSRRSSHAPARGPPSRSLLFRLPPIDPLAFAGSTGIILLVALLSTLGPAGRAARVDPVVALRAD